MGTVSFGYPHAGRKRVDPGSSGSETQFVKSGLTWLKGAQILAAVPERCRVTIRQGRAPSTRSAHQGGGSLVTEKTVADTMCRRHSVFVTSQRPTRASAAKAHDGNRISLSS